MKLLEKLKPVIKKKRCCVRVNSKIKKFVESKNSNLNHLFNYKLQDFILSGKSALKKREVLYKKDIQMILCVNPEHLERLKKLDISVQQFLDSVITTTIAI